jgi:arylsulfatase A-like enzyme
LLVIGWLSVCCPQAIAFDRPNILLMTVDNLGYGDLHCYNSRSTIQTPNLDRLAADGIRLTDFYTASPTCTVSRACLLTGRIADRHGLKHQLPGIEGNYGRGLRHDEILIPQLLRGAGYATGCFGKWNIGFAEGSRPTERGFAEFLGHASGNIDYYHHLYNGKHDLFKGTQPYHADGKYSTDLFADAAIDFIERQSKNDQPWFCYLPFNAPHFPNPKNKRPGQPSVWQAPDRAFTVYGLSPGQPNPKQRYAAVITALDEAIGRVLAAVDDAEKTNGTFVFWYSDNGAFKLGRRGIDVGSNQPLHGGGVTCWEGGIRVPAIARWPGHIKKGSFSSQPLWSPDLMIACTQLGGAALPEDVAFDGRDPLPVLTENAPSPHRSMYFTFRSHAALRMGDWKIVRVKPDQQWKLFNLRDDVSEESDLATQHPQKLDELGSEFARWQQSITKTP